MKGKKLQILTLSLTIVTALIALYGAIQSTFIAGKLNKNNEIESRSYNEKKNIYYSLIDILKDFSPDSIEGENGYKKLWGLLDKIEKINIELLIYGSNNINDLLYCMQYSSYLQVKDDYYDYIDNGEKYNSYYTERILPYVELVILQLRSELNKNHIASELEMVDVSSTSDSYHFKPYTKVIKKIGFLKENKEATEGTNRIIKVAIIPINKEIIEIVTKCNKRYFRPLGH